MCRPFLNSIVASIPSYAALARTLSDASETLVPFNTTIMVRSVFGPTPGEPFAAAGSPYR
jgi:hypothetical protein